MRLDHLLSKEQHCLGPRRMFSGVPSVFLRRSLVTRLIGSISTSAHQPVSSSDVRSSDRAVAGTTEIPTSRVFTALF